MQTAARPASQRFGTRWPSGRPFTTLRASVPCRALQTYPPTGCKQPTAVHNLIDGSVHNAFHLNNAFPGLNPTHTYARSLNLYCFCKENPICFYDDLGLVPTNANKDKAEKWQTVQLPWQHEFHAYNCIEFGRRGTKDEYVKHFKDYTFKDLPMSRRSYFPYSLVESLGMNSDTRACWCLDLVPMRLEKKIKGKSEIFRFSAFVRRLDKHPCCNGKEIHMRNMEGKWITITY